MARVPTSSIATARLSIAQAVDALVNYERVPDDVDSNIGRPGYVGMTIRGAFAPQSNITDARQRWLFRMVHTDRPLQEKMTLFWHNHFATGYTKIAGALGAAEGDALPGGEAVGGSGPACAARSRCCATTRSATSATSCVNIAKDTAMLVLARRPDEHAGRKPQENFGREIMELFTMGVGNYTEADVYAGARVFTGWNLARPGAAADGTQHYEFVYNAGQHDTGAKTFSFPIYADGSKTIPARAAADGHAGRHRSHRRRSRRTRTPARYLAEQAVPLLRLASSARSTTPFVERIASVYLQSRYDMKAVMREVLLSPRVLGPERVLRALLLAGRVRRPRAEGHRLDRLLGERRADAAVEHGADPATTRPTSPAGTRARRGSRPARCWRA